MTSKGLSRLVGAAAVVALIALAVALYDRSGKVTTGGESTQTAAKSENTPNEQPKAPPETTVAEKTPVPQVAENAAEGSTATPSQRIEPTFDIFRVEPTGDAVVAGRSEAGAIIALLANGEIVGKGIANESGEFAIVLDKPLVPGTHDVKIEAKAADTGDIITSGESIAVSIPDAGQGEVLVVLNKPGEATEVLQKPDTFAAAPQTPSELAQQEQAPVEAPAPAEKTESPAVAETPTAAEESTNETAVASAEEPSTGSEAASAPSESKAQPEQVASTELTKPEEGSVAAASQEAEVPATETAVAALPDTSDNNADEAAAAPTAEPVKPVTVEAVETEKSKVFVAGSGEPNKEVRVYVDNELVGKTKTDPTGRWLVEGDKDIAPGNVGVRADQIDSDDGNVSARAEVTFERAEEQIALRPVSVTATGSGSQVAGVGTAAGQIPNVIIRRGDNLWTISRRLYGQGLRYTTIYQANQGQILQSRSDLSRAGVSVAGARRKLAKIRELERLP